MGLTKAKCGTKFARSYKDFVFCTGCRLWLDKTPENNSWIWINDSSYWMLWGYYS